MLKIISLLKNTPYLLFIVLFQMEFSSTVIGEESKPELHYLVIDKSGSITTNGLQVPIRGAVVRFLGKVPENSEVRIRLFDHEMGPPQRYTSPFNTSKLGLASEWIHKNFKPGRGNTLLYGTVGTVFSEVLRDADQFSNVNIVILTDGDDHPIDLNKRAIKTPYRSWADVEKLSGQLKKIKGQHWVAHLYTISHQPKETPSLQSGIAHQEVPKGEPIDLITPTVLVEKPKADIGVHPHVAKIGEIVSLYPHSTKGIDTFEWLLSDGRKSNDQNAKFAFDKAGKYDVTLKVSGKGGEDQKTELGLIVVKADAPPAPPNADFIAHPSRIFVGDSILFTPISQAGASKYSWDFGDGSSSDQATPTHQYKKSGNYTVALLVSGPGGEDKKEKVAMIDVSEKSVDLALARFSASEEVGEAPLSVQFNDESEGQIASYHWDFGDENTSDLRNPEHTYQQAGEYHVRLTVVNTKGKKSIAADEIVIQVKMPTPPWVKWAIIGAIALLILVVAFFKLKPKPISGQLRYSYGDESQIIDLQGTRLNLKELNIPGWSPQLPYTIENKKGMKLLRNGVELEELDRRKEFELDGASFKYLP